MTDDPRPTDFEPEDETAAAQDAGDEATLVPQEADAPLVPAGVPTAAGQAADTADDVTEPALVAAESLPSVEVPAGTFVMPDRGNGPGTSKLAPADDEVLDTGRMTAAQQDSVIEAARSRAEALWQAQGRRPRRERHVGPWVISSIALLVAVASLAVNGVLLSELSWRRDALQSMVSDASSGLGKAASSGLSFEFPVKQTIRFVGDIPVQQDFDFPVDTTIAFNTTVRVPVDLGALGTIYVNVPINTSVPVKTTVPVHVDQTIHVDTEIPIEMTVPITLSPDQEPLKGMLEQGRTFLARLKEIL